MWFQSGIFICSIIVLNLNISFNFCARLDFNVIWFVKCMKIRKLKIEIISMQHNSLTQCTVKVSPLSSTRSNKTISIKIGAYSLLNFLFVTELAPFLQVNIFVAISAGGSFCWNYATDTLCGNYAGDNVCYIFAGLKLYILLLLYWWIILSQLCR